ncbi:MAG TPA: hemolysin family protein [Sandaracinaceae bacterium LLY-WYZ-13_1]|nr:hemolysin family protein [Sandaracinaceae bacterium LLY-WYZ-13_1]
MGLLVFFFLLSLVLSFLCSVWEAVLLSITPSYVSRLEQEGSSVATDLQGFKEDVDRPLSAILTLNTIAHTVGAIGVGAQAGAIFGENELDLGFTLVSYESIIAALMTLAILVLSEIVPKTLGANFWRALAPFTVRSVKLLATILLPFVWLSALITRTFKREGGSVFSRADFLAMTRTGEKSGTLAPHESTIIGNLLRLRSVRVRDIMTPRTVMVTAHAETTLGEFFAAHPKLRFSRIPVYEESPDHVTGFVLRYDVLEGLVRGEEDTRMQELRKDVLHVELDRPLPEAFDALTRARAHLAIVVDDYGGVAGLVTMEDVLETLLGFEIVDELDAVDDLQALARKQWEERAEKLGLLE